MSIELAPSQPERSGLPSQPQRSVICAIRRGAAQRCPCCGLGNIYARYLKIADHCPQCAEALHHHRADDAPAYFTIFIVGHVIVGAALALEQAYAPPVWVHLALWLPLTVLSSLVLLPRIKGALVALQWALRMHGFEGVVADQDAGANRAREPAPHGRH